MTPFPRQLAIEGLWGADECRVFSGMGVEFWYLIRQFRGGRTVYQSGLIAQFRMALEIPTVLVMGPYFRGAAIDL